MGPKSTDRERPAQKLQEGTQWGGMRAHRLPTCASHPPPPTPVAWSPQAATTGAEKAPGWEAESAAHSRNHHPRPSQRGPEGHTHTREQGEQGLQKRQSQQQPWLQKSLEKFRDRRKDSQILKREKTLSPREAIQKAHCHSKAETLPEEEQETTAQDRTAAKGQEPTEPHLSRTGASVQGTQTQRSKGPKTRFPDSNTKCSHAGNQGNSKRKALPSLPKSPPAPPPPASLGVGGWSRAAAGTAQPLPPDQS